MDSNLEINFRQKQCKDSNTRNMLVDKLEVILLEEAAKDLELHYLSSVFTDELLMFSE
ncbi:hypothetical protein SLEP1_g36144 [Rubroshorea leprosula]|uniref:Uncharacterized protein n=1 Tax=Rubroshorea leprosula TaxID=152421 RepID=A0AAV5KQJ3_9ROSI|nr:hypothetical protein SLEP1_g36144 [Rubroshorea leprosula]